MTERQLANWDLKVSRTFNSGKKGALSLKTQVRSFTKKKKGRRTYYFVFIPGFYFNRLYFPFFLLQKNVTITLSVSASFVKHRDEC